MPPAGVTNEADLRKEFEARLEAGRREVKELREEMRAQLATQSVAQGWQEDWVDEKRKLELVEFDGYLRVRPDLFYKFDMGRGTDPAGYSLFPRSPSSLNERTQAGVNMRFRFEPTINVSEEVRVRAQVDALDNLIWGSTPDYAFSRNQGNNYWFDRNEFSIFSASQEAQRSSINSVKDSIAVKRVWGEVSTPVGILRFGRMGSHWGLGMLYNDGNGSRLTEYIVCAAASRRVTVTLTLDGLCRISVAYGQSSSKWSANLVSLSGSLFAPYCAQFNRQGA